VGHSQSPRAFVPGQLSDSGRWHPGCRRCLLKGCERWFLPHRVQARYCSPVCQHAARRWRRWLASQRYRATGNGRQHRRDQARRHRSRLRQRSSPPQTDSFSSSFQSTPAAVQTESAHTTDRPQAVSARGVGQRPAQIPENSFALPCHRPGCYVLFRPAAFSLDQKFCSSLCRRALRRVRQREARLRHRRRLGARPFRNHHRGPPQTAPFMSSNS
jgi:hypothetical protein